MDEPEISMQGRPQNSEHGLAPLPTPLPSQRHHRGPPMSLRLAPTCLIALSLLVGCRSQEPPQTLGTLEWDRVELVSVAAEPVVAIHVHEGDGVNAGQPVLDQRGDRADAELAVAAAELERSRQLLAEQQAGARSEQKREVAARVERARAALNLASDEQARGLGLKDRGLISSAELERLSASVALARSELEAARASHDLVTAGTRAETIAQTRAAVAAAEQRVTALRLTRERLQHLAPLAGRVESLPVEVGDSPAIGTTVATLLVGPRPYARVYLSPEQRARTQVGSRFAVQVEGRAGTLTAKVRMLATQASFTPYYALSGDDANRLAYLAELELDDAAASELAAGLPVQAMPLP
jgi:HlyD family secretion protein